MHQALQALRLAKYSLIRDALAKWKIILISFRTSYSLKKELTNNLAEFLNFEGWHIAIAI
jgi:hypothetical protein